MHQKGFQDGVVTYGLLLTMQLGLLKVKTNINDIVLIELLHEKRTSVFLQAGVRAGGVIYLPTPPTPPAE